MDKVVEVKLGATRRKGGIRGKLLMIGGESTPAFYTFEKPILNPPVVAVDGFDMKALCPEP